MYRQGLMASESLRRYSFREARPVFPDLAGVVQGPGHLQQLARCDAAEGDAGREAFEVAAAADMLDQLLPGVRLGDQVFRQVEPLLDAAYVEQGEEDPSPEQPRAHG